MTQSKKEVNWSELCPEMVRCVFERLSFTNLKRGRSVCSSWRSALRGCVPKHNQKWLILFPNNNRNNNSSCVLFVPDDRDKTYKTRDLGVDFVQSCSVASYGSWLVMCDTRCNLNILNPLTGERIGLPHPPGPYDDIKPLCLWIDDRSKEYLVVSDGLRYFLYQEREQLVATRFRGNVLQTNGIRTHIPKLYVSRYNNHPLKVWSFSGDEPKQIFGDYPPDGHYALRDFLPDRSKDEESYLKETKYYNEEYVDGSLYIAVSTVSGQVF
ncbi:F-box protein [Raphanus sativus]|nr:F-box protein [Raphanus sativus]